LHEIFAEWNTTDELNSYLIEITADIFNYIDSIPAALVDVILDSAGQKGTGRWTVAAAFDLAVPIPTMTAAVNARVVSFARADGSLENFDWLPENIRAIRRLLSIRSRMRSAPRSAPTPRHGS